MAKYGDSKVEKAVHEYKRGELRSSSGKKVTSRQASKASKH